MFEAQKREIIKAGMNLDRYGLIALSGGNVSARMDTGEVLITPSGMIYEDMVEDDIVVMDVNGKIIEGSRKPSSDTAPISRPSFTPISPTQRRSVCSKTSFAQISRPLQTPAPETSRSRPSAAPAARTWVSIPLNIWATAWPSFLRTTAL